MFEHDEALARWFAQHGEVITVGQAAALGVGPEAMKRRADAGVLVREHHGVYRPAAVPAAFGVALHAAVAAARGDAWVSGHSLMRLFGTRGTWSDTPEITVLGAAHHDIPGVRVRRIDRIDPRDTATRAGLPILGPPLGLLTLGASTPPWKVESAVHDMVFQRHTTKARLVDVLKRYGGSGRNGVAAYRAGIRSLDRNGRATQTNLELANLRGIRAAGFPEPELQLAVVDGDGRRRRLDIAWPDRMVDLETDGDRWHTSAADRREMARRDAALEAVGYAVVRVDSDEVEHRMREVIAKLRPFFGG